MSWSRRQMLAALAAALALPEVARAFGEASKVDIGELDLGSGTRARPDAWTRLLAEVRATTSVETRDVFDKGIARVGPEDPKLFDHPFMVCVGDGAFRVPSDEGLEQISRYLAYGGLLLFDDATGSVNSPFAQSVDRLARVLFPTRNMSPLPKSHSLYRSFFLLQEPLGRVDRFEDLTGITLGGVRVDGDRREDTTRTPLILMRNDLSGALERDRAGRHPQVVVPGGERQRREAVKLGINLVMYCLTSNYKRDQVHVKELIESRRTNLRPGFLE